MSIRIAVERRAAAFAKIAPYMSADKRRALAEEIAEELRPFRASGGATQSTAPEPVEQPLPPIVDPPGTLSVVSFLAERGFQSAALVKATGRLTSILSREWVARYGDDPEHPVGVIPATERPLLERLYDQHSLELLLLSKVA
ncbi:hypothetical protein [Microbacterium sp. SORGH_AS_0862]|uniref:hypothetical protein n=1 Tax=Microbacterium sp. SORGH_AS_0862 TaxID=3041789 RepID=UPI002792E58B|nr:hypothetical protein [Microbacterium sp. SORGH_AS_0862]MDQ1205074.1 hypothetical protein [Microbacterium sp. SORGH_AS_0862]